MRILIVSEFFPESGSGEITGGVESRAFFVAKTLAKTNSVYVLTSRRPGAKTEDSFNKIKIRRVGPPYEYSQTNYAFNERLRFTLAAAIEARKMVDMEKIEIVDAYNFFTYPIPFIACLGKKARGFLTYHEVWIGSWVKNTRTWKGIAGELAERLVLLYARLTKTPIIAVSDFTKQLLIKNSISQKQICVIPNGVELSFYTKIKAAKEKKPTICFVGRLTKHKRVEDLIKAVSLLTREIKNIRCIIVGSGPEETNLRELVKNKKLENIITLTGFIKNHEEVLEILKSSHLFSSPSIVEGFGITLVEAIALGVPFVCSDIEPFLEVSENGKGGLLFRREDPIDLASKLKTLLTDKARYNRCILEEKNLANRFDWEKLTGEIEEAYRR